MQTWGTVHVPSRDVGHERSVLQLWELGASSKGLHCQNPHLLRTSTSTPSAGPMGDGSQPKKVSKVKATPKPAVKGSAGDSQKLKTAGGDELKPKEVTNTASGGASEETQGGDSTTTEPMGEPSTRGGSRADARSYKPPEVHQVFEGRADEVRGRRELWWTWRVRLVGWRCHAWASTGQARGGAGLDCHEGGAGLWVNSALQAPQTSDLAQQGAGGAYHPFGMAGGG